MTKLALTILLCLFTLAVMSCDKSSDPAPEEVQPDNVEATDTPGEDEVAEPQDSTDEDAPEDVPESDDTPESNDATDDDTVNEDE